jgi:hypothetical protein
MSGGPPFPASQLADLFQNTAVQAGQYASPPSFQSYNASSSNDDYGDKGVLIGVIIRSLLAIVFFFVFKGIGLIFAGYALYYAIQQKIDGDKYGTAAILIASAAAGAVGVGWLLRLAGY